MSLCSCPMSRRVVVLEEESGFSLYLLFQFNIFKISQFEFSPVFCGVFFTFLKKVWWGFFPPRLDCWKRFQPLKQIIVMSANPLCVWSLLTSPGKLRGMFKCTVKFCSWYFHLGSHVPSSTSLPHIPCTDLEFIYQQIHHSLKQQSVVLPLSFSLSLSLDSVSVHVGVKPFGFSFGTLHGSVVA